MGNTLRICLAMGGGVSLGSFSGAALTESLKLLILYGKDENGDPYDEIIVDGMSGASAGTIALVIMLRCLIDYKSMLDFWKVEIDNKEEELEKRLRETYANHPILSDQSDISKKKNKALIALELAQVIQREIWVRRLTAKELYGDTIGKNYKTHDLKDSFGLLDRGLMDNLAREFLITSKRNSKTDIQVLDTSRVLFACSLTNILPMSRATPKEETESLKSNIENSTGLFNHAEVRVIDFLFDINAHINKPSDKRWLTFGKVESLDGVSHYFDLNDNKSWAVLTASALACGAFPIAFTPVLLERYQEEYDIDTTDKITAERITNISSKRKVMPLDDSDKSLITEWPEAFITLQKNLKDIPRENHISFFNEEEIKPIDYKTFNFPYIDGGTFNNEPIKEAYRLASFQDFGEDRGQSERLILFVDPIVRKERSPSFNVASYRPINSSYYPKKSSEIDKFGASIQSILSLLINQGRAKEGTKINSAKANLELKETLFDYLDKNKAIKLTAKVCLNAFAKIKSNLTEEIISIGTRSPIIYFLEELKKIANDQWDGLPFKTLRNQAPEIEKEFLAAYNNLSSSGKTPLKMSQILDRFDIKNDSDSKHFFAEAVFRVIADISLDTAGKNKNAINVAILPIDKKNNITDLPGTKVGAFAGFASFEAKEYAFAYGRLSALRALKAHGDFRPLENGGAYLKSSDPELLETLEKYLENTVRASHFYHEDNNYASDLKEKLFEPSIERILRFSGLHRIFLFIVLRIPILLLGLLNSILSPIIAANYDLKGIHLRKGLNFRSWMDNQLKDVSKSINYVNNTPIIISIIGLPFKKPPLSRLTNRKHMYINLLIDQKTKNNGSFKQERKKIKAYRYKDDETGNRELLFKLYICTESSNKTAKQGSKIDSMTVYEKDDAQTSLKIVAERRTKLPHTINGKKNIDPNLDSKNYLEEYAKQLPNNVIGIEIDGIKEIIKIDYPGHINTKNKSLYHSLLNLRSHVNPMLQINVGPETRSNWYFKENTGAFSNKLLKKKNNGNS